MLSIVTFIYSLKTILLFLKYEVIIKHQPQSRKVLRDLSPPIYFAWKSYEIDDITFSVF